MTGRFSERYGYDNAEPEIKVREDAPSELRSVLVDIAYESGLWPTALRETICRVLRTAANPGNWSDFPNIDIEVRYALEQCEWFEVYDVIEEIPSALNAIDNGSPMNFEEEINAYFVRRGIGWWLVDGMVEVRGPETFEVPVRGALRVLEETGQMTAQSELREAIDDLSRRPNADIISFQSERAI